MRRVAILQSNYLPWKGYFDLIHDVDLFMFYDDVQYTVRDWRNRNRIRVNGASTWITVPVGADRNRLVRDVCLPDPGWQERHWKTLQHSYGKTPFFHRYAEFLRWFYLDNTWERLSDVNQRLIRHIAQEWLGIATQFGDSTEYPTGARKQERILDLLRTVSARSYVSGPAAKAYIDESRFAAEGIELVWKDYSGYPEYSQSGAPFEHAVSVLDLLFNVGTDAPWYIWGWRDSPATRGKPVS